MSAPFFFQCVVLDDQDPLMLGRVRARLLTDNYQDVINSYKNPPWDEAKDPWTNRDPFIFLPLLPYYIYQVPKINELINVLYYNQEFQYRNQYYIQTQLSTPNNAPFEYYVGAQKVSSQGLQFTNSLPIKNSDGTYKNNSPKGVFPEPGDNAIIGRGNADLVIKENGVLLRANKIKGDFSSNSLPVGNDKGGFLQISKFDLNKKFDKTRKYTELIDDVVLTKYIVEYQVINPENTQNAFSGFIYLYKLKPDRRINSELLKVDSNIEDLKSLIYKFEFTALSLEKTIEFINQTINDLNNNERVNGIRIFNPTQKFPIFYRPNPQNYKVLTSNPTAGNGNDAIKNLNSIFNKVRLNKSTEKFGYGLIYVKNKVGKPLKIKKSSQDLFSYTKNPVTYGSFGADKLFLLSQQSSIPNKGTINFDGTLYGISNEKYVDEIIPKTSSMVRGDELLDLLNLIVRFLATHTHSFPGLPPVPVGYDGVKVSQILEQMLNAENTILNTNIRLN